MNGAQKGAVAELLAERRELAVKGGRVDLAEALGAKLGCPDMPVVCVSGDGGFQMSIQELGTIMENRVPVKMILMNNNYLGNVRQWQDMFFEGKRSFTKMLNPVYEKVADAYGIAYSLVTDRAPLDGEVARMLATPGPYLLECAIKEEDNVLPMTPPGKSVDEMLLEIK